LKEMGYRDVLVLDGGMAAWQGAGLRVERGLTDIMSPPGDVVAVGLDRDYADMMNYFRWEEALGKKHE
jgi:3-mercaptopyruvate sulfurtransferase SseA